MRSALVLLVFALATDAGALQAAEPLGVFAAQGDIGKPARAGSATFDAAQQTYRVTGGGKNMWGETDAFHFVWKQISGDVSLAADVHWPRPGKEPHCKACLVIRQDLEGGSVYADAALHGDGLTALQYREAPRGATYEIRSELTHPARVRIDKQGDRLFLWVARAGEALRPAGGSIRLPLREPFYVGLGVCSHDDTRVETAEFANVVLDTRRHRVTGKPALESTLEVVEVASRNRRVIYHTPGLIEAPNWTPDGRTLLFNRAGLLYRLPVAGGEPERIDTGSANHCNNDHGLSPDGRWLAVSHHGKDRQSRIFVLPAAGGVPRLLTPLGPSYWHGWSPDGRIVVYCAQRNGDYDVYAMDAAGGPERRLTTAPGLDDGPDFSPDGKFIYFNSVRTGRMQLWRMRPDGSDQEQLTADDFNNWFPHPSPDGRWVVFLSYAKEVEDHPANKDVMLRLLPVAGGTPRVLAQVFGGQGTINVPSWAPDSRRLAFVSYLLVNR